MCKQAVLQAFEWLQFLSTEMLALDAFAMLCYAHLFLMLRLPL
jgi:hypothetical protein